MQPTEHERRLDDEIAQMTDTLLKRQDGDALTKNKDVQTFEPVIRDLVALFDEKPAPTFRMRMERTLDETWAQAYPNAKGTDKRSASRRLSLTLPLIAAAAAVAIVAAVAFGGDELPGNPLSGTALGSTGVLEIIVVAGIVVTLGAIFIWRSRR